MIALFRRRWTPDAGIHFFLGENGSGKTMVAVERYVLPVLELGFPVASNITVKVDELGLDPERYFVKIEGWRDILRCGTVEDSITFGKPCVVLFDEMNAIMPARQYQQTPPELQAAADMFRKAEALIVGTAPNFFKIEKTFRGTAQLVTHCTGFRPDPFKRDRATLKHVRNDRGRKIPYNQPWGNDSGQLWPTNLMFLAEDFRPETYELSATMPIEALAEQKWNLLRMRAPFLVDSKEKVGLLDHINQGVCSDCGLRQREQWCSCKSHSTQRRGARATAA